MQLYPAIVVHGLADARAALARGRPVTLVSAPGAGLYAGCLWWRALIARVGDEYPDVPMIDVLDCADSTGQALAALRVGVIRLILSPEAPGSAGLGILLRARGGFLLRSRLELF
jgi:hypothetical protein